MSIDKEFLNVYQRNGFEDRKDYLYSLFELYGKQNVLALSTLLGSEEDFDGLISMLEDIDY